MLHIISPHIDDAFLSVGGIMCSLQEKNVEIVISNVFTMSNWVNSAACEVSAYGNNVELVTRARKSEEANLSNKLHYKYSFLDFEDHPLRVGYTEEAQQQLPGLIGEKLTNIIKKEDTVFFPLGLDHVDHIIIRQIGLSFLTKGYNTIFYEDLPYAAFGDFDYKERHDLITRRHLSPQLMEIDIEKKLSYLKSYETQVCDSWLKDIKNYSYSLKENKFYERFWQPSKWTSNFLQQVMVK
jgi:hypothetical protein